MTGRTLHTSGAYAVVKEAIHIRSSRYFSCKVINKALVRGKESRVRQELAVLKKLSHGHPNIITFHDHFESNLNVFLLFDRCYGGDLVDRTNAKGGYGEAEAANLIRTLMKAVEYLHLAGIVHRNLKAEKLFFRTKADDSEVVISDFGISRIVDDSSSTQLTETTGTLGYMAPETLGRSKSQIARAF